MKIAFRTSTARDGDGRITKVVHDAGRARIEITQQMIEAGRAVLRGAFGGETEGQNRFVDFDEVARDLYLKMAAAPVMSDIDQWTFPK